jgi:hypothetical protein
MVVFTVASEVKHTRLALLLALPEKVANRLPDPLGGRVRVGQEVIVFDLKSSVRSEHLVHFGRVEDSTRSFLISGAW